MPRKSLHVLEFIAVLANTDYGLLATAREFTPVVMGKPTGCCPVSSHHAV
jgi:hypothetical protein